MADAAAVDVGQRAAPGQRRQHAAVPVGTQRDLVRRFHQHAAAVGVDGRHRPLAEDNQVLRRQAEALVRGEELHCLVVGCRAGHQIERNPHAVASPGRDDLLDVNLKERFSGDRPDGEHALGMVEPQSRALAAGHQDHAEPAGADGLFRALPGLLGGEAVLGSVQTKGRRRRRPRHQLTHVFAPISVLPQPSHQRKIDALRLPGQPLLLLCVQGLPERQQMLLAVRCAATLEAASSSRNSLALSLLLRR